MWKNVGKEVKHAFVGSKALQNFNALLCVDLCCVLHSNLCNDLYILSIGFEHIVHALEAVFLTQFSKEIDDLILLNGVGIQHNSLDILHVGVVLKGSTIESNLFTHLGNLLAVILSENVEFENTFGDIWSTHEVDFEHFSLKVTFILSVSFQGFKEEGSALLELVELEEYIHDLINLSFWWAIVSVGDHLGEPNSSLGINWHDLSKDTDKIWDMASLLAVWHDLIKLVGFNQTLNNFVWTSRLLINVESQLRIGSSDQISKLVGHGQLTLFDPVFNQIQLVLGNDWSGELNRLDGVQLGCLKESIEINQNWSWTTGLWKVLENIDCILISQKCSRSISGDVGGSSIIRRSNFLVK